MTIPTDTAFRGFPREGLEFLAGLAEDNSRAYFDAHRDIYEAALLAPAKAFVVALGEELRARVAPGLRAEPRVNGSILRINRDTRFTTDKRPYKEHLDFWFWEGDGPSRAYPGLFVRLRQPAVIGEILGGIVLGPSVLGLLPGNLPQVLFPADVRPHLTVIAQLGLVLFMFIVGLEVDLRLIQSRRRVATAVSLSSIALPFGLGAALAFALYPAHSVAGPESDAMLSGNSCASRLADCLRGMGSRSHCTSEYVDR